jgi:hypothetical protein
MECRSVIISVLDQIKDPVLNVGVQNSGSIKNIMLRSWIESAEQPEE